MKPAFRSDDSVGYRHEIIPPDKPDCPYLERWILGVGVPGGRSWFSVRLHHFFRGDEDHLHDHPTWFWTLVLRGSYEDIVECEACNGSGQEDPPLNYPYPCGFCQGFGQVVGDHMKPGSLRYRPALHRHRVDTDGVWTLCLFGPKKRDWGFMTPDGWLRQRAYFRRYGGSAACREVSDRRKA